MGFKIECQNGWLTPELDEILMYIIGGDWGKEPTFNDEDYQEVLCIRGSEIRNWQKNKGNTASVRKIAKSSLLNRQLIEGDILLEISGGGPDQPVGRTVLVDKQSLLFQPSIPKVCTNFMRLMRFPKSMDSKFINYYFDFFYASGEIVNYQGGSNNLRNLKFAEFSKIKMPLPPLNEQHRIVSKIEELFSDLDNGIANLKRAENQLKVYRQALLKAAFEGKLTEQWRKDNNPEPAEKLLERIKEERKKRYERELKDWKEAVKVWEKEGKKDKKPNAPRKIKEIQTEIINKTDLRPLTSKWKWIKIGEFDELISSGSTPLGGREVYVNEGIPFIRSMNVHPYNLVLKNLAFIDAKTHTQMFRSQIKENDVLLNITGASIGRCAYIPNGFIVGNVNQHVCIIRPFDNLINYKYLCQYLNSTDAQKIINSINSGATREALTFEQIKNFPFPLCTFEEQELIVSALENKNSIIEQLEQTINSSIIKSESLRQSILKNAFEGKLVTQDANDEPASELLKRIKAEKKKYLEEQKQQKKSTPKKIKKMSKELSIEEVLKTSDKPMLAKDVWQQSKHKENIEEFYAELKKIQGSINEVKKGTESLLSLAQ